jgi:hypothetical protein
LKLERRAGIEPANTGFADLRVNHFATGALEQLAMVDKPLKLFTENQKPTALSSGWVIRIRDSCSESSLENTPAQRSQDSCTYTSRV